MAENAARPSTHVEGFDGSTRRRSPRRARVVVAAGLAAVALALPGAGSATVAGAVPPGAGSVAAGQGAADLGVKPGAPGSITIDRSSITAGSPDVRVSVEPIASLAEPTVELSADGAVTVDGSGRAVAEGAASIVTIGADAPHGPSTITATLTGEPTADGTAPSISDTVWLDEVEGTVVTSDTGTLDLQLKVIDVREAGGLLTAGQADAAREDALGGGAEVAVEVTTNAVCATVCLAGTVKWTDAVGGQHVVRKATVQVWEDEPTTDQLVTTVTTDANGAYSATLANNDDGAGEGGRDPYVRVLAAGPGFSIQNRFIDGTATSNVATGTTVTTDLVANNTADNNTAFSLQNAMVVGGEYLQAVRGSLFPNIAVVFPGDGSYYDGQFLVILAEDRWDWDVMLHEYGHYVSDQLNIEANPGGQHSFNENLSNTRGKSTGTRLAWGEGWPTYFAISLLREQGTAALNIPNVGDTKYQDTEDASIALDLENANTLGEDNEVTNMSILWDLYDSADDGLDHLSLGTDAIWDTLDQADPTTLSAARAALAPGFGTNSAAADCVFSQHNVAPTLTGPATQTLPSGTPSPTFTWSKGNGGNFVNNSFVVEYRKVDGTLLFASPAQAGTSYTAPSGSWDSARWASSGQIRVTVVGTQTNTPVTGPYRSCVRQLAVDASNTNGFAPFASWGALVDRVYVDLTSKAPTPSERSTWVSQLTAATKSKADLVTALRTGADGTGNVDPATRLYRAFLQRIPDAGGLKFWVGRRRGGSWTLNRTADYFASSSEFKTKYGQLSNRAFVTLIYTDVLGRPADQAGVDFWTGRLDRGRATRGAVMVGFSESNEYKIKTRADVDVAVAYVFLLGRAPTTGEASTWTTAQGGGSSSGSLAQALMETAEYATHVGG